MKAMVSKLFRAERADATNKKTKTVDIETILRSGENGLSAHQYARMTDNLLRPSERFINGPHVRLLQQFEEIGEAVFDNDYFTRTDYFRNARECISFTGRYFEAKVASQIIEVARNFIAAHKGKRPSAHTASNGHNGPNDPIVVAKVEESNCWTLISGNHRLASRYIGGHRTVEVEVLPQSVRTPLQDMLKDVHWQKNRTELYQPIPYPEVCDWPLVRKCTDRGALISKYLSGRGYATGIDIGCSYGWFVRQLSDAGLKANGVDRDLFALKIAEVVYGVNRHALFRDDILHFLEHQSSCYDVVLCLSVLHHFALGLGSIGPEEFLKKLDQITGSVLLFDTGESHEEWFRSSLSSWSVDYIVSFVKSNSSFTKVEILGRDSDNVGPYSENYGRTLFACTRE